MKICKNCGRQTDDGKVRCPYCGYLFEEDMDSVLRKMKENLNTYKDSVVNAPAQPQAAQPAQPAQAAPAVPAAPAAQASAAPQADAQPAQQGYAPAADPTRERFELLAEVAQLKGELRALHTEIDRMNGPQYAQPVQYMQQPAAAQYAQPAQQGSVQPAPAQYAAQPQTVIYANAPAAGYIQGGAAQPTKAKRSGNRIFLSIVSLLLLGLSIGMFFVAWIEIEGEALFKGFDGILYLFNKENENVLGFAAYLAAVDAFEFAGGEMIANVCRAVCKFVVEYGVIVYAAFLILGFPLLFSMFGKISCKGWHRFVSWMSFIVALILFGVFCWITGFSSVTVLFLVGGGANFVRCIFLAFYRGKKKKQGGLE